MASNRATNNGQRAVPEQQQQQQQQQQYLAVDEVSRRIHRLLAEIQRRMGSDNLSEAERDDMWREYFARVEALRNRLEPITPERRRRERVRDRARERLHDAVELELRRQTRPQDVEALVRFFEQAAFTEGRSSLWQLLLLSTADEEEF